MKRVLALLLCLVLVIGMTACGKKEEKKTTKITFDILQKGDEGVQVKNMQLMLKAKGYSLPKYGADGDYGAETVSAVKKFQKANGLTADGVAGAKTLTALYTK